MLHYYPLHVSSSTMLIIRRSNCIITVSGIVTLCRRPYSKNAFLLLGIEPLFLVLERLAKTINDLAGCSVIRSRFETCFPRNNVLASSLRFEQSKFWGVS